jgi:hypothetical protein
MGNFFREKVFPQGWPRAWQPSIVIVMASLLCLWIATTRTDAMNGIERTVRVVAADRNRLLEELTTLPYTYNVLDPKYLRLLDSRDITTALLERQRRFMRRWDSKDDPPPPPTSHLPTT